MAASTSLATFTIIALMMSSSALVAISGTMTSGTTGVPLSRLDLHRGLEDRARLHLGDFGIGDGKTAAAMARAWGSAR